MYARMPSGLEKQLAPQRSEKSELDRAQIWYCISYYWIFYDWIFLFLEFLFVLGAAGQCAVARANGGTGRGRRERRDRGSELGIHKQFPVTWWGGLILLNTVLKKGRTPNFSSARKARRFFPLGQKVYVHSVHLAQKFVSKVIWVSRKNYYYRSLYVRIRTLRRLREHSGTSATQRRTHTRC